MLDPKFLRNNIQLVQKLLKKKKFTLDITKIQFLEKKRKDLQVETENLQAERKKGSKEFGIIRAKGGDTSALKITLDKINIDLKKKEEQFKEIKQATDDFLLEIPNIPHENTPEGNDESNNLELRCWGTPKDFDFEKKDHIQLGEPLGLDFEAGAQLSGSRFTVIRGALAPLYRALAQFMLDVQTSKHGYEECYTPYLVHAKALKGTGQLPKFESDLFKTQCTGREQPFYLIPTSEVTLTNLVADKILEAQQLPIKLTALSPCFRSEAGSYGKDTKGMIRQHQFDKVEMVQVVHPDTSFAALEEMTNNAEYILQQLNLPYRVVSLCGGDLGFSAAKTHDIEVWLPGQNKYREVSSISNCTDFQARRMYARFKNSATEKPILVHTLNGSGLAVGRAFIAVLENYQTKNGNIEVPEALQPFMKGIKIIQKTS